MRDEMQAVGLAAVSGTIYGGLRVRERAKRGALGVKFQHVELRPANAILSLDLLPPGEAFSPGTP
jgi:hypothetical protein